MPDSPGRYESRQQDSNQTIQKAIKLYFDQDTSVMVKMAFELSEMLSRHNPQTRDHVTFTHDVLWITRRLEELQDEYNDLLARGCSDFNRQKEILKQQQLLIEQHIRLIEDQQQQTSQDEFPVVSKPDFSLVVLSLGKAFEKEINLSVVQWMRGRFGIDFPVYFYRYQPGRTAQFLPEVASPRPIDLNSIRGNQWKPLTLGEAELGFKTMSENVLPRGWKSGLALSLRKQWSSIRISRNIAAHEINVGKNEMDSVLRSYNILAKKNILKSLYHIKTTLRSGDEDSISAILGLS